MKTYEQVLETVELALAKGEYHYCIEFLLPIIESFPLSSRGRKFKDNFNYCSLWHQ